MSEFDLVLYGASGFTGRQAAAYLARTFAQRTENPLRWALAGRNLGKLRQVRSGLGEAWAEVPLLEAEAQDLAALRELSAQTRVVLSTAGPFARYGENLVRACLDSGTDYLDITGETPWVRHLIDQYHSRAQRKQVRIVPFCGVDSIPSDLGALFLVRETQRRLGAELHSVQGFFQGRGGLNGGTLASVLNLADDPEALERLQQPYLLNPGEEQLRQEPADQLWPVWDPAWWVWTAPYFMAPVNTRVVRRSEALYRQQGQAYGPDFVYTEAAWNDEVLPAKTLMLSGLTATLPELLKSSRFVSWLRKNGPQPGEGPSQESLEQGFLSAWFRGRTAAGQAVKARFFAKGDPGNRVTVTLLCESALMLLENREQLPAAFPGGVLTPATALGLGLLERLHRAGMQLEWIEP